MSLDPQLGTSGGGLYPASTQSQGLRPIGANLLEEVPSEKNVNWLIDSTGAVAGQAGPSGEKFQSGPALYPRAPGLENALLANYRARIVAAGDTILLSELEAFRAPLGVLMRSTAWNKLRELWVPAGAGLAAARVKLKSDSTSSTSMTAIGSPVYAPFSGVTGNAASIGLNTGFNPTTAGLSPSSWGFGVYCANLTGSGVLGGTIGDANSYLCYNVAGDSRLNFGSPTSHPQYPRLAAVQLDSGQQAAFYGGQLNASAVANGATFPNSNLALLTIGGGFWSNQTVAGFAVWTPALTAAELTLLGQFFDAVNTGLERLNRQPSALFCGDSNTFGTGSGVTAANRFSKLVSDAYGMTEDNQGVGGSTMSDHDDGGASTRWVSDIKFARTVARSPTFVVNMFGTNDDRYKVSAVNFQADYTSWLNFQFSAGISPEQMILMSPPACTDALSSTARQSDFTDIICALASSYGCGFVDVFALTLRQSAYFQTDLLHLNAAGHAAVAAAIQAYIATTLSSGVLSRPSVWK